MKFRVIRRFYHLFRTIVNEKIIEFWNPTVKRDLPDTNLHLYSPMSHVRTNESEVVRIAQYVAQAEGCLKMIDVGANIGAVTLLTYAKNPNGSFFCIDGNEDFFPFLQKNIQQIPDAGCLNIYLSDKVEQVSVETKTYVNTANILENPNGKPTHFDTLDHVIEKNKLDPNFIKIDTDGYDSKIIRGLENYLAKDNAVLYFEYAPMHQVFNQIEKKPTDLFLFLHEHGVDDFYFYDENGCSMGKYTIQELDQIEKLTTFCLLSTKLFDVLVFHRNNQKFKDLYEKGEKRHIEESISGMEAWWKKR